MSSLLCYVYLGYYVSQKHVFYFVCLQFMHQFISLCELVALG